MDYNHVKTRIFFKFEGFSRQEILYYHLVDMNTLILLV